MQEKIKNLPDTVALDCEHSEIVLIDQTLLPRELKMLRLCDQTAIIEAIKTLRVRGAPAIGVTAAFALYLAALDLSGKPRDVFDACFASASAALASSRPTAVNLFWAIRRMNAVVSSHPDEAVGQMISRLRDEALAVRDEDIAACHAIGENALTLLRDGMTVLTHCNAGQLATVRYGTALSPLHLGRERGMNFRVYADETRPLLQGARLTAFELCADGIDTTVICDGMGCSLMREGKIDAVLVGSDRIAANGDVCNKIGTSAVAAAAKHYGVPFYALAPVSTVDFDCPTGSDIPIELRDGREIGEMWYDNPMLPAAAKTYNPAFDVTDADMVSAIVTERGIFRPGDIAELAKMR